MMRRSSGRATARGVGLFLAVGCAAGWLGCERAAAPAANDEIAVSVRNLMIDPRVGSPVVMLSEEDGERQVAIWIGLSEAHSIASEIDRRTPLRPNTHDLAKHLVEELQGSVVRVVVTELRENIYYAVVELQSRGRLLRVDARPSDAIAIGLRSAAPIFVRDDVFGAAERGEDTEDQGVRGAPAFDRQVPTRSL